MVLSQLSITREQLQTALGVVLTPSELKACQRSIHIFSPQVGQFWDSETAKPGLYIVLAGKVRLLYPTDELMATLTPGMSFGATTLISWAPSLHYSARSSLDVTMGYLSQACLAPLLEKYPQIASHFQTQIRQRIGVRQNSRGPSSGPRLLLAQPPRSTYFPRPDLRRLWTRMARRYTFVGQQSAADCGAACLVMIARYWGRSLSLNRVRDRANINRSGASLRGLALAAEALGLSAKPVKIGLKQLAQQRLPAIAHWEGKHYIVVYAVERHHVIIADPAIGQNKLAHTVFKAGWTGYTLLLDPTPKLYQKPTERAGFWNFLELLKPHRLILCEIFLTSLLIQIFGLVTPLFTQLILDRVVVQQSELTLSTIGLGLLMFGLFRVIMQGLRQYLIDHTANRLDLALIVGFIRHCLSLPLPFFDARYVGDIVSRVHENRKVQKFLSGEAMTILLDFLTVFIYLGLMAWYSWQMALIVTLIIPPFIALALIATPFIQKISREIFTAVAAESSYLIEILTGMGTIKSSALEQTVRWQWEARLEKEVQKNFSGQMISNQLQVISNTIQTIMTTVMLWYGATLVIQNQLTIGQLVAFNMLLGNILQPFQRLTVLWNQFQEVLVAVERINDVLEAPPEEPGDVSIRPTMPTLWGHIQFDQVTFRYHPDQPRNTLENLSFQITPGQMVALVGRSGSGKTTVSKLLLGLYPPNEGKVLVDGHDLSHVSLTSLRQQIGIVDQATFLFGGTIRENITLGYPDATLDDVIEASRLAGAASFIQQLPLGYETPIGEGGGTLSGGQRQRLAIARALLGNPKLLIFDEATSHLDNESERLIQNNMAQILQGRTSLVIAHRLSTIRQADLILVLDQGRLVEQGHHDELLKRRGHYYYLNQN